LLKKNPEQVELSRGQFHRFSTAANQAGTRIEVYIANGDRFAFMGGSVGVSVRPPQDGMDTRNELAGIEGLWQVIVGTDFKSHDSVDVVAPCGQHQDRNLRLRTELPQKFKAVQTWQHDIKNHERIASAEGFAKSGITIVGKFECEILVGEKFAEELAKLSIVINY
jgi:hypothetical protein